MMKLTQLLERLKYEIIQGSDEIEVTELINDSRKVTEGSVFVCISGAVSDGHTYVKEVAEKGAIVNEVRTKIREKEKNMTTEKTAAKEDNTKDSKEQKEGDEYNDFESNVDHLDNQSKTSSQKEEVKVEQ